MLDYIHLHKMLLRVMPRDIDRESRVRLDFCRHRASTSSLIQHMSGQHQKRSLATLGHIAWLRLDDKDVRFTVIPEHGSQLWSVLAIDTLFETYTIQSQAENNAINLEVPLAPLQRALKSAHNATAANIRLTKKDNVPLLSLTITTSTTNANHLAGFSTQLNGNTQTQPLQDGHEDIKPSREESVDFGSRTERETVITQDVPIRVLAPASVDSLHEPRCRDPDVHIVLPNLLQLKNISDRFTKLALATKAANRSGFASSVTGPKLELSANMHGCLRLALSTDAMRINSLWTRLENPELDPTYIADGEEGLANHPSTRMKELVILKVKVKKDGQPSELMDEIGEEFSVLVDWVEESLHVSVMIML
ncbi:hypothetical protein MRB53_040599 [Persea americana]|nr:hypothetical protein MRB53_040599 [Persea americana]